MLIDFKLPFVAFYANQATNTHDAIPERDSVYADLEQWKNQEVCTTENRAHAVAIIRDAMERNLTRLDLSGLSLTQMPPIPAPLRDHLDTIDLSDNLLGSLPEELAEQPGDNLKLLDVRGNPFTCSMHALTQALSNRGIDCLHDQYDAESEEVPCAPNDDGDPFNHMSLDDAIEAYKKTPHSDHPIWEPRPRRPWAEPLVQLLGMSMPLVQNWAQGKPLLGSLPEPRRNDLAVDDPAGRVYAFMNDAHKREAIIISLNLALDELEQNSENMSGNARDVLEYGRKLSSKLEDSFAGELPKELAAEVLDFLHQNADYCADTFSKSRSAETDRQAGRVSWRVAIDQAGLPNPARRTDSREASKASFAAATSDGPSALEANIPLLGTALAGVAMTRGTAAATAAAAVGAVGALSAATYGLYRWISGNKKAAVDETALDPGTAQFELNENEIQQALKLYLERELYGDEDAAHDMQVIANLQILPELESLIAQAEGTPIGADATVRRRRSEATALRPAAPSAPVTDVKWTEEIRAGFEKYEEPVAKELSALFDKIVKTPHLGTDEERQLHYLMEFHAALISLAVEDDEWVGHIILKMAAITEAEHILEKLGELRDHPAATSYLQRAASQIPSEKRKLIERYKVAFSIKDHFGEKYIAQQKVIDNVRAKGFEAIKSLRSSSEALPGGENSSQSDIYLAGMAEAEYLAYSFKQALMTPNGRWGFNPEGLVKQFRSGVYMLGLQQYRWMGERQSAKRDAEISKIEVAKYHLANRLIEQLQDYGIRVDLQNYGILYQKYSGDRAALEAKRIGFELTSKKYGIESGALNDENKIIAFSVISQDPNVSDEVKSYLKKAAAIAYDAITHDRSSSKNVDCDTKMLNDFSDAAARASYFSRLLEEVPEGYNQIKEFKRSNEVPTWEAFYEQFSKYKEKFLEFDAKRAAYGLLIEAGLTDYDISQMKPEKVVYGKLDIYYSADPKIKNSMSRAYVGRQFANNLGQPTQVGGTIAFVSLSDGRLLVLSGLNNKLIFKIFTRAQVESNSTLKKIRDDRHISDYGINPKMEGHEITKGLLVPLFGQEQADSFLSRDRSGWRGRDVGFPILHPPAYQQRGWQGHSMRQMGNEKWGPDLLPVLDRVMKDALTEWVGNIREAYKDRTAWNIICELLPFCDEIHRSATDPEHKLDIDSIVWDVIGVLTTLFPMVGSFSKLAKVLHGTVKQAILNALAAKLTGPALLRGILIELSKKSDIFTKVGLRGLAYAGYAVVDLASPIPPDLIINAVARQTRNIRRFVDLSGSFRASSAAKNLAQDDIAALMKSTTVDVGGKHSIELRSSLLTDNEAIEESRALMNPIARRQPAVKRAGVDVPYSIADLCAPGRSRVKRGIADELLSCLPQFGAERKLDRIAAGDISPLSGRGPFLYTRDGGVEKQWLEHLASVKFEAYRYDDFGGGVRGMQPLHMERPVKTNLLDDKYFGDGDSALKRFVGYFPGSKVKLNNGGQALPANAVRIDVLNGDAGALAVKIPFSSVTEGRPIFADNNNLSGCTVVYAVKDDHFYIYHSGISGAAQGYKPNWRTSKDGVHTIIKSHEAITGRRTGNLPLDNNALVDLFSEYDSAVITYFGKEGARITKPLPGNVKVFDYNEGSAPKPGSRVGQTNALLTRSGDSVAVEVMSEDYFNEVAPGQGSSKVAHKFDSLKSEIFSMGRHRVRSDREIRLSALNELLGSEISRRALLNRNMNELVVSHRNGLGAHNDAQALSSDDVLSWNVFKMMVERDSPINPRAVATTTKESLQSVLGKMDWDKDYVLLVNDRRMKKTYLIDFPKKTDRFADGEVHIIQSTSHPGVAQSSDFDGAPRLQGDRSVKISDLRRIFSDDFTNSNIDESARLLKSLFGDNYMPLSANPDGVKDLGWTFKLSEYSPEQFEFNLAKFRRGVGE
ncbi:cycle-inhibiting factor [Burkholderia ubonensis]|uniref:cycle-inhibiting factor n=1 Tax=Burkholderia ubonensis TaxID=101571 RepID=UPI0009B40F85|nr:cycle-inhibiting factor [Burkholderia ubonensis]